MVSEGIGIFFFITIPLNTALRCVACKFAPFAIGLTVAFCIMSFGAVTAASINTARALRAGDRGWQANRDTPLHVRAIHRRGCCRLVIPPLL